MLQKRRCSQPTALTRSERVSRRRIGFAVLLFAGVALLGNDVRAYNKVWVESKTVDPGETSVTVGVWVVNSTPLTALTLALEMRDTDANGSFATGPCTFNMPASHRVGLSPLVGSISKSVYGQATSDLICGSNPVFPYNDFPLCSGPVSHTYKAQSPLDFISPDGFFWAGVSTSGDPDLWFLPPGSDSVAGTLSDWPSQGESTPYAAGASFNFVFTVNSTPGTFEIDTMCVCPANKLLGQDELYGDVAFAFAKGVVTIAGPAAAPPVLAFIASRTVTEGETLTFDVLATDPNGTTPALTAQDLPLHATFTDHNDGHGTFEFTPVPGQAALYDVWFFASDGVLTDTAIVTITVDAVSSVRSLSNGENVPSTCALDQSYPNPFNASTVIRFDLPSERRVRLEVLNILGRKVRTLLDDARPAGSFAVEWDGTDDHGTPVSTGVYFYRIQTLDYAMARSMVLLK